MQKKIHNLDKLHMNTIIAESTRLDISEVYLSRYILFLDGTQFFFCFNKCTQFNHFGKTVN